MEYIMLHLHTGMIKNNQLYLEKEGKSPSPKANVLLYMYLARSQRNSI